MLNTQQALINRIEWLGKSLKLVYLMISHVAKRVLATPAILPSSNHISIATSVTSTDIVTSFRIHHTSVIILTINVHVLYHDISLTYSICLHCYGLVQGHK